MHFTDGQQPDLIFAISRVKILSPRLHAFIQDEARCHKVTSLSVTMEVVIATAHSENFSHSCCGLSVAQCKDREYISCLSKSYGELTDMYMWSGKNTEETGKTVGFSVGDFSLANRHEPLDASHGARIMAKEVGVSFFIF